MSPRTHVLNPDAASCDAAAAHFAARLAFEADCVDVAADVSAGITGFVAVDCRSPHLFAAGHVPGAINIPHRRITAETAAAALGDADPLVVTYCNGPHCNASTRAALRFAALGWRVKDMPGGMDGWVREGLPVDINGASHPGR